MEKMRRKKTGSYDIRYSTWRLKEVKDKEGNVIQAEVSASCRQLSAMFGVEVPRNKRVSEPYWQKFLAVVEEERRQKTSPLAAHALAVEREIAERRAKGLDIAVLESNLVTLQTVNMLDVDEKTANDLTDTLWFAQPKVRERILSCIGPKAIPEKESLKAEASLFCGRYKEKGPTQYGDTKNAIELFMSAVGEMRIKELNINHWRAFLAALDARYAVKGRTNYNVYAIARRFVAGLGANHAIFIGWLDLPENKRERPIGKMQTWTMEQVQFALAHATGEIRSILLCGLNFGQYMGDIKTNTADMVKGSHLVRSRAKNDHKDKPVNGSWLIWQETAKCLNFEITAKHVKLWAKFIKQHNLPEHSDLRKTVTNWMQYNLDKLGIGEDHARLYRCERPTGTHGTNYANPELEAARDKLDRALLEVEKMLFG